MAQINIKSKPSNKKKKHKKMKTNIVKKTDDVIYSVSSNVQVHAIKKSIKQNYIFYITIIICIYAFTQCTYNKSNFILSIFSFIFIIFYGYFIHVIFHWAGTKVSDCYKTYDNIFTRNKYLNWLLIKIINFGEFHSTTHHDSEINKTKQNIALEFINNVMGQGGLVILLKLFLQHIDNRVILLWAFYYATVHNINYIIKPQLIHQQHHMNENTNYGVDICDIIVGSKYDWNLIETYPIINLVIIAAIIVFFSNKCKL